MRVLVLLTTLTLLGPAAHAAGARSLPVVGTPQVVDRVFNTPAGEVQFTASVAGPGAFLRNDKGGVSALFEVKGPFACEQWMVSGEPEALPDGCEFFFQGDASGAVHSVRSDEMTEGDLFQTVRGTMRGQSRYVSL